MCIGPVVSGRHCLLGVTHLFWLLWSFIQHSLLHSSLSPKGRGLWKTSHLGLKVVKTLILWTLFNCRSWLVPIYCKRKLLWRWLSMSPIYEYSGMSLIVILLLCSFSRTIVFGIPLSPWPIYSQFFVYPSRMSHKFLLMECAFNPIKECLVTLRPFVPPSHQYITQAGHCADYSL